MQLLTLFRLEALSSEIGCVHSHQCLVFSQFAETFCHFSVLVCFFVIQILVDTRPKYCPGIAFSV
jgi:hypothetical protein